MVFANQMRVLQKTCSLVLEKIVGKFWTFWDSPLRKEVKVKGNSGLLLVYYPFIPFVNRNINYAIAFRHTNDLNNVLFNFCIFFLFARFLLVHQQELNQDQSITTL